MTKVFQLVTSVQIGGAEIIAFDLAEHCNHNQAGHFEFIVVELYKTKSDYSNSKRAELAGKGIRVITLSSLPKRMSLLFAPFGLLYYIFSLKPAIIHSHTDLPDFVLATTMKILSFTTSVRPGIVRTIQNSELWPSHKKIGKFTELAFNDDIVVGVSEVAIEAYKNLRHKNGLSISKDLRLINNTCTLPTKRPHPFSISPGKINIAYCGRFEYQKGIDIWIDRIREINHRLPDVFHFHIIGSGSYRREVELLVSEYSNISLHPAIPNISDKMYAFDFLIIPSRFEGLILTSIEASLSNVPVIASIAPGLSETLPDGWPLAFHLENSEELLQLLRKLIAKEFDIEALKQAAFLFVSEKYSHSRMIQDYSKLYCDARH